VTGRRLKLELTEAEVRKLLSILGMAEIEYADLIERVCLQTGQPIPKATREWLAERRSARW
jgi:hypothetical protein